MCDVPSIAVFCSESIEYFPGTASKFFLKLFVTIPVAPIIIVIIGIIVLLLLLLLLLLLFLVYSKLSLRMPYITENEDRQREIHGELFYFNIGEPIKQISLCSSGCKCNQCFHNAATQTIIYYSFTKYFKIYLPSFHFRGSL